MDGGVGGGVSMDMDSVENQQAIEAFELTLIAWMLLLLPSQPFARDVFTREFVVALFYFVAVNECWG